jgi:pimeloyl-ACP methyl ester carboxylesterase
LTPSRTTLSVTRELKTAARVAPGAAAPILVVYGAETPPRSRAEMEALAALPGIRSVQLPRGKLAVHEEFPDATAEAVDAFLREPGATQSGVSPNRSRQ